MPFVLLKLFSLQDCKKGKGISQADLFLAPRTFPWTGTPQLCSTRTLSEVWLSRRSCAAGRTPCLHSPALRLHQETPGLTVRTSKSSLAPALSFLSPAREKKSSSCAPIFSPSARKTSMSRASEACLISAWSFGSPWGWHLRKEDKTLL